MTGGNSVAIPVLTIVFMEMIIIQCILGADKVKLKDVSAITLHKDKMTTGRRSNPVPQIKCIGGSAGCYSFIPQTVQCYNRGSDGHDVQWECKTDMDKAYKFGQIEVTCEGYDYPDDPYVLRGSCGLEYTLELASGSSSKGQSHYSNYYNTSLTKKRSILQDILFFGVIGIIIYTIYKTCIANRVGQYNAYEDDDDYPDSFRRRGGGGYGNFFGGPGAPPGPGFRPEFTPGGCGGPRMAGTGGNSFWTGATVGGVLGYLFGSSGNRGNAFNYGPSYNPYSTGSSFSGESSSSFTRSTSGFGGTSRR